MGVYLGREMLRTILGSMSSDLSSIKILSGHRIPKLIWGYMVGTWNVTYSFMSP